MLGAALPLPPDTEADNQRMTRIMFDLDQRRERAPLSPEKAAFSELLTIVIQDFEQKHYSVPDLPPHELLQCLLEQRGMKHKDMAAIIGNKGLTTEILAGRRREAAFEPAEYPRGNPAVGMACSTFAHSVFPPPPPFGEKGLNVPTGYPTDRKSVV